jgi:hypothetical protein
MIEEIIQAKEMLQQNSNPGIVFIVTFVFLSLVVGLPQISKREY